MDFHSLSRKELQALCKKNKIPANITNVAMANALSALPHVEGLDEFFNPIEAEKAAETPIPHRGAASRTATGNKPVREEQQSSKVVSSQRPQRGTRRAGNGDGVIASEQENKDANVLVTPAAKKRAPAVSLRRKKEVEAVEDDEEKNRGNEKIIDLTETPAAVPSSRTRATGRKTKGTSVQQGYSTRRSVRLLEKNLSNMSLMDAEDNGLEKVDDVSEEIISVSQQIEDSADTEEVSDAGASLKTVTDVVSGETNEQEVCSMEMKTESEYHQVNDLGSEVQAVSVEEIDVEPLLEAESEDKGSSLKADSVPRETNVKLEGSCETLEDSNKGDQAIEENDVHGGDEGSELSEIEDDDKSEDEKDSASSDAVIELNSSNVCSSDEPQEEDCEVKLHHSEELSSEVGENLEEESEIKLENCEESMEEGLEKINASDLFDVPSAQASENLTVIDNSELLEKSSTMEEEKLIDGASDVIGASSAEESKTEVEEMDSNASEEDYANPNSENSSDVTEKSNSLEDITLQNHQGKLEETSEDLEEKDASAAQICIESSADVNHVTLESSLIHLAVREAEEQKDESDQLKGNDQHEDSNDDAAAEEIATHDDSLSLPILNPEKLVEDDLSSEVVISDKEQHHAVAEEVATDDASLSLLSFNCDTAVEGDSSVAIADKEQHEESNVQAVAEEVPTDDASLSLLSSNCDTAVEGDVSSVVIDDASLSVLSFNCDTAVEGDISSVVIADKEQHEESNFHAVAEEVFIEDKEQNEEPNDDSAAKETAMDASMHMPSFNSNTLVKACNNTPIQSVVVEQSQEETKGVANEIQTVDSAVGMKENRTDDLHQKSVKENRTDDLHQKSVRELRKMLKKLGLNNNNAAGKEVERKRTALQVLPENQNTPKAK
nr:helicase SWR1 isoform X2 [Arachis hypogaea]